MQYTHDHWIDRLSGYLDGDLAAGERSALEAHLVTCGDCTATLEELRQVVRAAAALPDEPPARDLWAGIDARLADTAGAATPVISLDAHRRRLSFTLPQLAAASIALVAVSSALVWLLVAQPGGGVPARVAAGTAAPAAVTTGAAPGTGVQEASGPLPGAAGAIAVRDSGPTPASGGRTPAAVLAGRESAARAVRLVRGQPVTRQEQAQHDYDRAVSDLEAVLRRDRSRLRPETVKALEASLADIDRAIAEARKALARDPADVYLNDHLAESMRLKLELLQQAAAITQS